MQFKNKDQIKNKFIGQDLPALIDKLKNIINEPLKIIWEDGIIL